mmetsp:Transcript_86886/g.249287  ORF Transcript_86886/g.249287 Transcript_86886/m.249287 type:complete len:287 (-) Transcript_86886:251-1111(-)
MMFKDVLRCAFLWSRRTARMINNGASRTSRHSINMQPRSAIVVVVPGQQALQLLVVLLHCRRLAHLEDKEACEVQQQHEMRGMRHHSKRLFQQRHRRVNDIVPAIERDDEHEEHAYMPLGFDRDCGACVAILVLLGLVQSPHNRHECDDVHIVRCREQDRRDMEVLALGPRAVAHPRWLQDDKEGMGAEGSEARQDDEICHILVLNPMQGAHREFELPLQDGESSKQAGTIDSKHEFLLTNAHHDRAHDPVDGQHHMHKQSLAQHEWHQAYTILRRPQLHLERYEG